MEEEKRIRVVFKDDDILSDAQKSEGLNRSWFLLKPYQQHATFSDIASHLLRAFQLHRSCPRGLILSVSGFVLPPFESTAILKENEIIRVRKRRSGLSVEGNTAGNELGKLEAVKQKPVNNGVLLLADEEFDKEKGGYESDDPEEEDGDDLLQDKENPLSGIDDPKNRKRKAPEKLIGSEKKKQRNEVPGDDDHAGNIENSSQDGVHNKKKRLSREKKTAPCTEDNLKENVESAKLHESNVSVHEMEINAEAREDCKEPKHGKIASNETKKVPSRSARRKYAKRRWLREMAKIQKTNAACESESLRNWKEDHAKAEKNKSVQLKGPVRDQIFLNLALRHGKLNASNLQQNWKKQQVDAERAEVDGQPKGLLHWKQSPQDSPHIRGKKRQQRNQNVYFHKHQKQSDDVAKQLNQKGDGHIRSNQNNDMHGQPTKRDGIHEQPNQRNGNAQQQPNQNDDASMQPNQEGDNEENEVIPIVIRPGHIRFEPLGREQAVPQNHVPWDTFQWNGITSKKKGQKWGKENNSFTARNEYKTSNEDNSELLSSKKVRQPDGGIDYEKFPPLSSMPKEGDLIAYRILELSSSWTPELSVYRVGKVSWCNAESNKTMLVPVPEYPIVTKTGEDEDQLPDTSLYKDDGSLEIDFSALIDVRILNDGSSEPRNGSSSRETGDPISKVNATKTVLPSSNDEQSLLSNPVVETAKSNQEQETQPPTAENGGTNLWDQIAEALNAKKAELTKESSWGKTPPKKVQVPQKESSWGKNVKNVQQSSANSWGKNAKVVHPPSQENSWGKESSASKSSSYNAARGGALGPTMSILRSIYRDGY